MSVTKPEMRTFTVEYRLDWAKDDVRKRSIRAAYFKEEDGFVTFKDDSNQAVYAIRNDTLLLVERVGLDEHLAELEAILDLAGRRSDARGCVTTRKLLPDGTVSVTQYEVKIRATTGQILPASSDATEPQ
jgi:hypothetical protein